MAGVRKRIGWATALAGMVLLCWSAQARAEIGLTTDPTGRLLPDGSYLVSSKTVLTLAAMESQGTPDVIYHIAVALYGDDLYVPPIGKAAWRTASFRNVKKATLSFKLDTLQDRKTPIAEGTYHLAFKYSVYAGDGHAEGRGSRCVKILLSNAPMKLSPRTSRPAGLSAGVAYNLVENAGFEKADPAHPDRPAGFVSKAAGLTKPKDVDFTWETPGYNSKKAVAIEIREPYLAYWETVVPVKPMTDYVVSFYYKCRSVTAAEYEGKGAEFRKGRPGGPNLELGMVPHDPAQMGKPLGWSDIGMALGPVGGTYLPLATDWAFYRQTVTTRVIQTRMRVKLRLYCYRQKVWFDNLSVVEAAATPKVELASPRPDEQLDERAITFRWTGPKETRTYAIECSTSPGFTADTTWQFKASGGKLALKKGLTRGPWFWRVGIPDNRGLQYWTAPSAFHVGKATWTKQDTTPPVVFLPSPPPNTAAGSNAVISAKFRDEGAGVDVASARILLDGRNVTAQAKVTADGFTLKLDRPPAKGEHHVKVQVSDKAGNAGNALAWRFGVGKPLRNETSVKGRNVFLNGEPWFPVAIYSYCCHPTDGRFREDHLAQATAAGFDCLLNTTLIAETGDSVEDLDILSKHGMMSFLNISLDLKSCTDPASAKNALMVKGQGQFKGHPCVIGYWADDPENLDNTEGTPVPKSTLDKVSIGRQVLNEQDPGRMLASAISNLPRLRPLVPFSDVIVAYRYPVPQYHPQMIWGWTLSYVYSVSQGKPVFFNSQAIDLGYARLVKSTEGFRPTPAEVRVMAYHALVIGVRGYSLYANYLNAKDYPEHWRTALEIASEFRHLAPALAAGRAAETVSLKRDSTDNAMYFREIEQDGVHTLIAVNPSGAPVAVEWYFKKPVRAAALFEDRIMPAKARRVSDVFEPFGVHVYRWQ